MSWLPQKIHVYEIPEDDSPTGYESIPREQLQEWVDDVLDSWNNTNHVSTIRICTCDTCGFSYYKETPHTCTGERTMS